MNKVYIVYDETGCRSCWTNEKAAYNEARRLIREDWDVPGDILEGEIDNYEYHVGVEGHVLNPSI